MRRLSFKTVLAVAALAVAGLAAWTLFNSRQNANDLSLSWPEGRAVEASFAWLGAQTTRLGVDHAYTGEIDLAGRVRFTGLGRRDGAWQVSVVFLDLDPARRSFRVLGQNLVTEPGILLDGVAVAEFEDDGALRGVRVVGEPNSVFARVAEAFLKSAQVRTVREGDEATMLGLSQVRYRGDGLERTRERTGYRRLLAVPDDMARGLTLDVDGRAQIELSPDGYLAHLDEREQVTATRGGSALLESELRFTWDVERVFQQKAAVSPALTRLLEATRAQTATAHAEPGLGPTARRLIEQQAGDATPEGVLRDLRRFARGELPNDTGWIVQAAAVLTLEPELSHTVAAQVLRPGVSHAARGFALDLLAQVGHADAQAALRTVLLDDDVRADPRYLHLLQRLTLVRSPTRDTVALAEQRYADADPLVASAAAHSLGALAGSLQKHSKSSSSWRGPEAQRIVARLQADLDQAGDAERRAALVSALGNTGMSAEVASAILVHSSDDDPAVRRAAATALRTIETDSARARLIDLMTDPASEVQRAALQSLMPRELSYADQGRIAELVEANATARINDQQLVTLLSRSTMGSFQTRALEALLARNGDDAKLRARIRKVMAQAELARAQ